MCDLFGSDDKKTTQTQSARTSSGPEKWVREEGRRLYDLGGEAASRDFPSYGGQRLAGFQPAQQASFDTVAANQGSWSPAFNIADIAGATGATSFFSDPNVVAAYMNPYQDQVLGALRREAGIASNDARARVAAGAGSYGDSADLAVGQVNKNYQDAAGQLLYSGYDLAGQRFQSDMDRALRGSEVLSNLGRTRSYLGYTDADALFNMGQVQQGQRQAELNIPMQEFYGEWAYPMEQVNWLNSLLRSTPYTQKGSSSGTSTVIQESQGGSPIAQSLMALAGIAGAAGTAFGVPNPMAFLNAGAGSTAGGSTFAPAAPSTINPWAGSPPAT